MNNPVFAYYKRMFRFCIVDLKSNCFVIRDSSKVTSCPGFRGQSSKWESYPEIMLSQFYNFIPSSW
jgi:hypothetical protein